MEGCLLFLHDGTRWIGLVQFTKCSKSHEFHVLVKDIELELKRFYRLKKRFSRGDKFFKMGDKIVPIPSFPVNTLLALNLILTV